MTKWASGEAGLRKSLPAGHLFYFRFYFMKAGLTIVLAYCSRLLSDCTQPPPHKNKCMCWSRALKTSFYKHFLSQQLKSIIAFEISETYSTARMSRFWLKKKRGIQCAKTLGQYLHICTKICSFTPEVPKICTFYATSLQATLVSKNWSFSLLLLAVTAFQVKGVTC